MDKPGSNVELTVPASSAYTQIIRLVLSGIGNAMGLNLEEIEDLKLAVGEACYNLFSADPSTSDRLSISAQAQDTQLVVDVRQHSEHATPHLFDAGSGDKGIGLVLLQHLMDKVEYTTTSSGVQVRLIKYRNDDAARTA